jgi:prepilin-type N-terminal cleavage/methylation domain-containing protein
MKHESGFTLMEVIIGLSLFSAMTIVATMSYTAISKLNQRGTAIRNVQQNGRYMLEGIVRDVRAAKSVCVYVGGVCNPSTNATGAGIRIVQNDSTTVEYRYDSGGSRILRQVCPCSPLGGSSIASDNVRVTGPTNPFQYNLGQVKIDVQIEQLDNTIPGTDVYAQVYNLSTVATIRGGG